MDLQRNGYANAGDFICLILAIFIHIWLFLAIYASLIELLI